MLRKTVTLLNVLLSITLLSSAQILGGGTQFSNAVIFNQSWLTGCPAAGTSLSNQVGFEPTTTMDACAPVPACPTGTTGSDIWFSFFAQSTTAKIVINPSASFNVAIQAFSGSACPGIIDIGCTDAGGNNAVETLNLSGLVINELYYFRVFGSSNGVSNRTGTYTFCGSTQLGSTLLAVEVSSFTAAKQNALVELNWNTVSESDNAYFEIERSSNGSDYKTVGRVNGKGTTSTVTNYSFTDVNLLTSAITYYRLKEVSSNGIYKYSAVVRVKMDNKLNRSVQILSNPVMDKLNVRINSDVAGGIKVKVINNLGQVIYQQSGTVIRGDNIITVHSSRMFNLLGGIYTLQVIIDNEILNTKFLSSK